MKHWILRKITYDGYTILLYKDRSRFFSFCDEDAIISWNTWFRQKSGLWMEFKKVSTPFLHYRVLMDWKAEEKFINCNSYFNNYQQFTSVNNIF